MINRVVLVGRLTKDPVLRVPADTSRRDSRMLISSTRLPGTKQRTS